MKFSNFGQRFTREAGILHLMDDLGQALSGGQKMLMLGGGNPSHIPAVQRLFRQRLCQIMDDGDTFERLIENYDSPQGETAFVTALATLLKNEYGWPIGPQNIALTNGSQTSFFYLFNLLAGDFADGSQRKIMLPLTPEYIGYVDTGLADDLFIANKPEIHFLDEHTFKYRVNFEAIGVDGNKLNDDVAAICVSRPTNPTGNVLTDAEINQLSALARANDIPLIIDNAYGVPFPNIIFTAVTPIWAEHIILCMSLSKVGLPGARTGIIIANEAVIRGVSALNAIISLAPGSFGAALALDLVQRGEIIHLSRDIIKPFYKRKADQAVAFLWQALDGLDFYIHKAEGALFLWIWFKDLPITSQMLYERLKRRGALIVPGHYFYPGLTEAWSHKQACIRLTYSQDEAVVKAGINLIAEEVKRAYDAQ